MSAPTHSKGPKEKAFELLLGAAIQVLIRTVDTVRFVRKMRRRYKTRHVKLRHAASWKR